MSTTVTKRGGELVAPSPERMLQLAQEKLVGDVDPQVLLDVANAYIEKWERLVEEQEAGAELDGRASIYTGESYAEARDRWRAYRDLLLGHLRAPDGGLH